MKLVDGYEENQGNPRGEVVLDLKELRSLLGLANYYRCFNRDFFKVTRTLSDLFKKPPSQGWDEPCYQAFGEFKSKLSSPPVLKILQAFKGAYGGEGLYHRRMLMQNGWPLHMRALSSMVVGPCPTCGRNDYPKSGMSLVTKSLESLRASCFRRPCSSSWSLTKLLRYIRG